MKIIISPAKKMNTNTDTLTVRSLPPYLQEAEYLRDYLKGLSYEELKELWKCNDQIATLNYERLQKMEFRESLTPALLAYEGIQYQYMAQQCSKIISGNMYRIMYVFFRVCMELSIRLTG